MVNHLKWNSTGVMMVLKKNKYSDTCLKIRKNLFKTIAVGVKTMPIRERDWALLQIQQEQVFITKEQTGGRGQLVDGKLPKADIKGRGNSG